MRIRALSVFEGVVYHCWCVALLRPGDADADSGPLLLSVADYITMAGGLEVAGPCLDQLRAKDRIVEHLDVPHITFPTWTTVSSRAG